MWQFWIDRGGTFTDIVARTPEGEIRTHKVLSENPEQYRDAAIHGIKSLLNVEAIPAGMIEAVKMGTTVATNALLERKGDATVLLITKGFKDMLRIGYQHRPKLFDLQIILPELLYQQVIEASERMTSDGEILQPFDAEKTRKDLQKAYDHGIRSVAITFLHGYRYTSHEKQAAKIAEDIGFTQISLSHEVSPLVKLISRGDTTVVDAYLSPILRRYVAKVREELISNHDQAPRLMFMQSHGGLTDAHLFQGKDAILSGPAGGVVGMVRTAKAAGYNRLIGFDMGGTSTDVCHYAGTLERSLETEVAGVRMRAPMMNINTVAAGGGSIIQFKHGRMQVGPKSAGADPGPACYRHGGPLTVTDCNVLLGRIQPEFFPHVFGKNANEPLDANIVRIKFQELSEEIAKATNTTPKSPEELAAGFLRIAIENMANAIKKISVQRGYDITEYVLNCFGGAGGQHATQIADVLGMETIFIHPHAGVLSALGMGMADIRCLREVQFAKPLDQLNAAENLWQELDQATLNEVRSQGVPESDIQLIRTAHIRNIGAHQNLEIPFSDGVTMRKEFEAAHLQRFGYVPENSTLLLDVLATEAVGVMAQNIPIITGEANDKPALQQQVTMFSDGLAEKVNLYQREKLQRGVIIKGPAIIIESTGTNVIEAGWQAEIDFALNLIIRRYLPRPQTSVIGTDADPIMLEVFNNLFMSIAEQMGAVLANTASSVNIKERLDFSCAIFSCNGDLVANAPHMPVHLGSMGESVRTIMQRNLKTMRAGDVYMMNNPYDGGTHLPDVTVITPVFDDDGQNIIFVVASRGHHADIGGTTPGSAPANSRHIEEEGVVIDNFLLVREGKLFEEEARTLLESAKYPCRNVSENIADLCAHIAANVTGVSELKKMVTQFSLPVVQAYMQHVQDNAEASVREVLGVLKDCHYRNVMDDGSAIEVTITVDQKNKSAVVDFTGTSAQHSGNYNAPAAVCRAAVLYVFRTLVDHDIPLNEGCLKPLTLFIPEKSMINPQYPAAVVAGNTEVSQTITDTLYAALGVIAGAQGTMNNTLYGNENFQNYDTVCGGSGAGAGFHGTSAVHTHMTNTRLTDPEVLENRFPVRVQEFSIRKGSGGAGQYHGGDGIIRKLEFREDATLTVLSSHRKTQPLGAGGGNDGMTGENSIIRADGSIERLQGNDSAQMGIGDTFVLKTPGGGGFGQK